MIISLSLVSEVFCLLFLNTNHCLITVVCKRVVYFSFENKINCTESAIYAVTGRFIYFLSIRPLS